MSIAAIVLAAGTGSRMGKPKAMLELNGRLLVEEQWSRLLALGFAPVVVVVNRNVHRAVEGLAARSASRITPSLKLTVNLHPELGQLHSVRIGVGELSDRETGVLLQPVDHPFVGNTTYEALRAASSRDRIVVPVYHGRRGHPPLFGSALVPLLNDVPLEEGARGVYRRAPERIQELQTNDPGILLNANTPADWERGLRLFPNR